MSFYDVLNKYKDLDFDNLNCKVKNSYKEFIYLLSEQAEDHLEDLAQRAHELTLKHFGKTIGLYTPLYLSNYCENECLYCGFNLKNNIERRKLTLKEVEKEAKIISSWGLKHILILTGESREKSSLNYIKDCIKVLKNYFSSISIEIYPLTEEEYLELISLGVDGLTIYQEVYDEEIYNKLHLAGPKKNYQFRLDAPEAAANVNMRTINIGVLLGLSDFRKEVFLLGVHAKYLHDKFGDVEFGISLPRVRPQLNSFKPNYPASDKNIVQAILALRIFLPRIAITISTRENAEFRDNLIPLGITRMSAGSTTSVGGRIVECETSSQFEISDKRSVTQIKQMLENKGYQPVFKDW